MNHETLFGLSSKEILLAIQRRRWLIILSAAVVTAAVGVYTLRQPKLYAAAAGIIINPSAPQSIVGEGINVDSAYDSEYYFHVTQQMIVKSPAVLERALLELRLTENEQFRKDYGLEGLDGHDALTAGSRALGAHVEVKPQGDSRVLIVEVRDYDPERSAVLANQIAQSYIDQGHEDRIASTRSAFAWLDERVSEFANKMEVAEKSLFDFKRKHTLVSLSIEDRQNMMASSLSTYSQKFISARTEQMALKAARRVLATHLEAPDSDLTAVPWISKGSEVLQIKSELNKLRRSRSELTTRYGPQHPRIQAIEKQIYDELERYRGETQTLIQRLDNTLEELQINQASLETAMAAEKNRALDINNLALEYNSLAREVSTIHDTYKLLLKRRTEVDLSGLLDSAYIKWYQRASPSSVPVHPSLAKNAAAGLSVGLLLGILLALAGPLLDNTIHTREDVENLVGTAWLGLIPSIAPSELAAVTEVEQGAERDTFVARYPDSPVAECARSVRTNLLFLSTERPLKRILVTSAAAFEGKTSTAVSLGIVMARAGQRVLIVDTDLRKPRLHRTFGVPGDEGLTSSLLNTTPITKHIKATDILGLDLLPAGRRPPNPAELLHTAQFKNIVSALERRYDLILFDSPPVNAVTDAAILSAHVDGTIMVVKANATARDPVRRAKRHLDDVNAPLLGVVLNQVDPNADECGEYYEASAYGVSAPESAKA